MAQFCLQVQPQRFKRELGPPLNFLDRELTRLSKNLSFVSALCRDHDESKQEYINYNFTTSKPKALWGCILNRVFRNKRYGGLIKKASIVVCTGDYGWDDYLLLHSFNKEETLDSL